MPIWTSPASYTYVNDRWYIATGATSWTVYTSSQTSNYNAAITWPTIYLQASNYTTGPQWLYQAYMAEEPVVRAPAVISARTRRRMQREERAALRERERMDREHQEKSRAARERARKLLLSGLTNDQKRSLEERNYFDLNVGGRHYRIHQGTHGNVRLVEGGIETTSYCIQPNGVPAEDAMLAQKLLLETDEPTFLRIANARFLAARPNFELRA